MENPSAAPGAAVPVGNVDTVLAGRVDRLCAALVNLMIVAVPIGYLMLATGLAGIEYQVTDGSAMLMLLAFLWLLIVVIIDLDLLYRNGQSIGKKLMGIKIVREDGSRCALWRIVFLRIFVNALPGYIPIAGRFYSIIDCLFIFGASRRCIHDYIAETIVVRA